MQSDSNNSDSEELDINNVEIKTNNDIEQSLESLNVNLTNLSKMHHMKLGQYCRDNNKTIKKALNKVSPGILERFQTTQKKSHIPAKYRRADDLSALFEFQTECAAVGFLEKKIVISTNKFTNKTVTKGKKMSASLNAINVVMQYYKNIAKNPNINFSQEKEEAFKAIITNTALSEKEKSTTSNSIMTEDIKNVIADFLLRKVNYRGQSPSAVWSSLRQYFADKKYKSTDSQQRKTLYSNTHELIMHNKNGSAILSALETSMSLYEKFIRLAQSIKSAAQQSDSKTEEEEKITLEQLTSFKNYSFEQSINKLTPKKDTKVMHAEIQILFTLLKDTILPAIRNNKTKEKIHKQYYIGISKKCCRDCSIFLESCNLVLKNYYDRSAIVYRAAHNAAFTSNWVLPKMKFEKSSDKNIIQHITLMYKILKALVPIAPNKKRKFKLEQSTDDDTSAEDSDIPLSQEQEIKMKVEYKNILSVDKKHGNFLDDYMDALTKSQYMQNLLTLNRVLSEKKANILLNSVLTEIQSKNAEALIHLIIEKQIFGPKVSNFLQNVTRSTSNKKVKFTP